MIHHEMEVDVDDMITKLKEKEDYFINLAKVFNQLRNET